MPFEMDSTISIHAPREGGDVTGKSCPRQMAGFQSTPPARGATLMIFWQISSTLRFQSTPPARGATRVPLYGRKQ